MKRVAQYVFTFFWILAVAGALYLSRNWNSTTALFPQAVGLPILVVLVVIFVAELRKGRRQPENAEVDKEVDREFVTTNGWMILYLGWLVGFAILVWAIGIVYAIPIYIFCYMTIQGKYGWLKSGLYAVIATAFIFLLFRYAFQVAWPEGALISF